MTSQEVISLFTSISSLVLSVVAIWLSLYFYSKSKDSEKNSEKALEGIKSQTNSLERLNVKWMDRLTRHITEAKPQGDYILDVITLMQGTTTAAGNTDVSKIQVDSLTQEAVTAYIGMFYYSAFTNVLVQSHMPTVEDFDITSSYHNTAKNLLESSHTHYKTLETILSDVDQKLITNSPLIDQYKIIKEYWADYVKSLDEVLVNNATS